MTKPYNVIIVEDEAIIREALAQDIPWSELGCAVQGTASHGIEGIELCEEAVPHLIISDIKMPVMDGLAMVREIRNRGMRSHVILLTGHEEFSYAQEAIDLSVDRYLLKPIALEMVIEAVRDILDRLGTEKVTQDQIAQSLPVLRQVFLSSLLQGRWVSEEEVVSRIRCRYPWRVHLSSVLPVPYSGQSVLKIQDPAHFPFMRQNLL